jgi:hypothetical protein
MGRIAALLALAAMLLPASSAVAGGEPLATKSGALVNYVSTAKLKLAKKMYIYFVCSADCNAQATNTIKGPGARLTVSVSGAFPAGAQGFVLLQPNKGLLKRMKATPGKFKLANTINATNPATGATDSISHTFRLKKRRP